MANSNGAFSPEKKQTQASAGITLQQVTKSFGDGEVRNQVLFDIDLQVNTGCLSLLIGPSGCGKTTLISIIAGILNADSGCIEIFGERLDRMSDGQKTAFRKKNIGFIFQQFNLVPTLTALENVAIPLFAQHVPRNKALDRAAEMLAHVGLAERAQFMPKQLSGGQQQRVAIARALVSQPKLLVCDEPTASLDGQTGHAVMGLLKSVSVDAHRCVIVVTHDNRIYEFGDSQIQMEDGRIQSIQTLSHAR
ncbi:MAG: ABC transporter ATP-binding protein [Candidatus Melainabacteria bacterium]|nr:ABC transporter ATP-binding protein [Candidatus Melainabacteria bacterium]